DYAVLSAGARSSGAGPAGSMIIAGPGTEREVLLIEPMRGDPRRRVQLPDEGVLGPTFSTIVDGRPIAGTVLHAPLRVVIF
ncbi:MAG TPA: hypothetical protein VK427_19445, partial [Kofleriaceae bacterium]|nr:hypothetical protein [Kofleriaceae bacterium]